MGPNTLISPVILPWQLIGKEHLTYTYYNKMIKCMTIVTTNIIIVVANAPQNTWTEEGLKYKGSCGKEKWTT